MPYKINLYNTDRITFEQCGRVLATARNPENGKPLATATRLFDRGSYYAIQYHNTDVVEIHPDGKYVLNSDGYRTRTTKVRMNEYAPVSIYQRKGVWYVSTENTDFEYFDGLRIGYDPDTMSIDVEPEQRNKVSSPVWILQGSYDGNGERWDQLGEYDERKEAYADQRAYWINEGYYSGGKYRYRVIQSIATQ